MAERGVIRNREYARQIKDFSNLKFGKITPTDLDAFMDFGNALFIFVEAKHGNSKMPFGQKLAFERLVDACHTPPERISVGFLVSHKEEMDVDYANTIVREYRFQGKWLRPAIQNSTLLQGINVFRKIRMNS